MKFHSAWSVLSIHQGIVNILWFQEHLGEGVMTSNAKLTELDLSDNAFGPNGIKGAVNLLSSPACFSLKILTLNNVGLGIGGAKVRRFIA